MITLNAYTLASNNRVASNTVDAALPIVMPDDSRIEVPTLSNSSDTTTVSTLARQLSEAATRAEARVGQTSADRLGSITGDRYLANKAQHDTQTPNTNNPELLARARQATGFINGTDSNPFKGLTRDQLNLIAHDDGGSFTINERRAAWQAVQPTASPEVSSSTSGSVNGREILISRYFGGSEPPVALPPATLYNAFMRPGSFLNRDDRALIADMYAYAQAEGADLAFVDRLASTLGNYRNYSDGRQMLSCNISSYDADRYWVTFDFAPEESASASRILNGSAIGSTRLDQGFVRYILDPGFGALQHAGGISFLERMVNKFSSEGADQPPLGNEFANLDWSKVEDQIVRTVHKDVRLPPFTEPVQYVNGVRMFTEEAKAAGDSLDETTGAARLLPRRSGNRATQPVEELPVRRVKFRALVDVIASTQAPLAVKPKGVSSLFQVMRNNRP